MDMPTCGHDIREFRVMAGMERCTRGSMEVTGELHCGTAAAGPARGGLPRGADTVVPGQSTTEAIISASASSDKGSLSALPHSARDQLMEPSAKRSRPGSGASQK